MDAIMMKLPVSDLFSLANRRPSCAQILDVDLLTSSQSVPAIAKQLKETGVHISEQVARGMGRIAREFGFSRQYIDLEYLTAFVEQLVSSFYLEKGSPDIHTQHTIAKSFVHGLACEKSGMDVMAAYLDRVQKGTEHMMAWNRKAKN